MAYQIGGRDIAAMDLTYSWGLSPASASVTVPGTVEVHVGDAAVMNLGGLTFHGVIIQTPVVTSQGRTTELQLVDNRIRLMWEDIYASFNNAEVREDNPETPGIDRQKRFWHIYEDDWEIQAKTWTDAPLSGGDILDLIFSNPRRVFAWTLSKHADQTKPVYDIDANNGSKVGTIVQEITEQQGLVFTVASDGATLVWARKGDGDIVIPPADTTDLRDGDAMSNNDTNVRIVGDRNRYQDLPIELEPDWKRGYEQFWAEPAWLKEVEETFEVVVEDVADQAALVAKARSVTVREYVTSKGDEFADQGKWGEVGRMDIPVWIYLQDIVWKAYRIPLSYVINTSPLVDAEIDDGLLAEVTHDPDSGELSYKSPVKYYPDTKAYVIAKGQPIDLLDPRTQGAMVPEQLANARNLWSAQNRFNLDVKNKGIIFEHAVFLPGVGAEALFLFPNRATLTEGDPLYNIAVPNANVTVEPAPVRASIVFSAERYSKQYGSGVRHGSKYVSALSKHALAANSVFQSEVPYADGDTADSKAEQYGAVVSAQQPVYQCGGYTRTGTVGTPLSGVIDRVTVSMSFTSGLEEKVEFTKERAQNNYTHERDLDRKGKARDLFPNQRNNEKDVERLEIIARLSRELKRTTAAPYPQAADVLQKPVGAPNANLTIKTLDAPTPAGAVVWNPGPTEADPQSFGGIVVCDGSSDHAACATSGTVPMRLAGPFTAGQTCGAVEGEPDGQIDSSADKWHALGTVLGTYSGSETILVPVQLGAGGAAKGITSIGFFYYQSPYVGAGDPPPDQALRIRLVDGVINADLVPDEMGSEFTLPDNTGTVYLVCTTTQGADGIPTGASLAVRTALTPDPLGTIDVAPESSSRPLWKFTTAAGKITQAIAYRVGGLEVYPLVVGVSCTQVKVRMTWEGIEVRAIA